VYLGGSGWKTGLLRGERRSVIVCSWGGGGKRGVGYGRKETRKKRLVTSKENRGTELGFVPQGAYTGR